MRRITRPPTIFANGLSINFAGTSSRTQILNFQATTIITFTYIVTPTKEGVFEIPSSRSVGGWQDIPNIEPDPESDSR